MVERSLIEVWPLLSDSWNLAISDLTYWCERNSAEASTTVSVSACEFTEPPIERFLIRPSSHEVSMVLSLNASVSSSFTKYSTGLRISPRTSISLSASTSALRASSRVGADANKCPNCESANSWMPPLLPTEKYPQTEGLDWNLTRSIFPLVGLKPSSGFSAVMRAAITCFLMGRYSSLAKSIGVFSVTSLPYMARIAGTLDSGMPMAICNWVAGRLTPVSPSVTGCSTCRRGLSSRKKNLSVSALYKYSTVPAPVYPMDWVRRIAASSISRKVSGLAMVGGPSSKIFWKRRCVEQSRPLSATALPCSSPTI
mmetsp:Transcript_37522/g.76971  ORF Transcript_37522/g.76971 Transcript_37522/m.76971 type:complete len:312 (+) Transcript_37522:4616-5551(+)